MIEISRVDFDLPDTNSTYLYFNYSLFYIDHQPVASGFISISICLVAWTLTNLSFTYPLIIRFECHLFKKLLYFKSTEQLIIYLIYII